MGDRGGARLSRDGYPAGPAAAREIVGDAG